jgi:hypothetical protein
MFAALIVSLMVAERALGVGADRVTVDYEPTNAIFPNPERGFYHQLTARVDRRDNPDAESYRPLVAEDLARSRAEENTTLVLRMYYLDPFIDSAISDAYLASVEADFDALREGGAKAIVRFAYRGPRDIQPYNATKRRILSHIGEQLGPLLARHVDVIATVQAGFIGRWGEWWHGYASHEFARGDSGVDYTQYAQVVDALLAALPDGRFVQVRTPGYKKLVTGVTQPLGPDAAYTTSAVSRVGHHNDCFLADDTDMGTYSGKRDREYLERDTLYAPIGGETCRPNEPDSLCENATRQLARFHWSYINWDYHGDIIDSWRGECLDEVQRRLGYRLELVSGEFPTEVVGGEELRLTLVLRNVGYAAPFNPRDVEIVLRHSDSGAERALRVSEDPRLWLAGETQPITVAAPLDNLPAGGYDLFLNLPDPQPSLRGVPAYSIRLANEGVWEESTGYNRLLHAVLVQ